MIISKEGAVTIEGGEALILAETMGVLDAVYQMLRKNHDEEYAKARIESLGGLYIKHLEEKEKQRIVS